jgi:hypothetical protein
MTIPEAFMTIHAMMARRHLLTILDLPKYHSKILLQTDSEVSGRVWQLVQALRCLAIRLGIEERQTSLSQGDASFKGIDWNAIGHEGKAVQVLCGLPQGALGPFAHK